ncbi:MAG TPA: hypothetical protein VGM81_00905 [Burkholderiaceae bacterium]
MFKRLSTVALLSLSLLAEAALAAPVGVVTIQAGPALLMRENDKLASVEGVALQAGDIVELPANAQLLRMEFSDGASLLLAPGSRVLLSPKTTGERGGARAYLLAGWAKVTTPAGVNFKLLSPTADLQGANARVVMGLTPGMTQVFAENGDWQWSRTGAAATKLKSGDFATLKSGGKAVEIGGRPTPEFIKALPRAFMDALPSRYAMFQGKTVTPKNLGPITYDDAQAWIDAEPTLRRAEVQRWRELAQDSAFRQSLIVDLNKHPEWEPILFPGSAAVKASMPKAPASKAY